jgi:short-subunit dehydrogenase
MSRLPLFSWAEAVVVVTGASRGIGREVALEAARRGARLGLIARSGDELDALAEGMGPGRAVAVSADVTRRQDVEMALARVAAELGPIDALVANAGIGAYGPFKDMDLDLLERMVQVNFLGTAYAIRAVLSDMVERGAGRICVVASVAGRFGPPLEAAYGATKFAQVGLAEAVAVEVRGKGVGVSIVDPGAVDTTFFTSRGYPYARQFPKPIPASRVAATVMRAVEAGGGEFFVPRPFRAALSIRHLVPRLYGWGTARTFRGEL